MTHKRTNPFRPHSRNVTKPYGWDYPSQGLRFPRTLEEAFGPGDHFVRKWSLTQTHVAYGIALVLLVMTLIMLFTEPL